MNKLKMTPVFMLAVVALCALVPTIAGISLYSIGSSAAIVVIASLLVERGANPYRYGMGQRGDVGEQLRKVENEYKETQTNLKQVGDELRQFAEKSEKELKNQSQLQDETRKSVDSLLTEQGELNARLKASEQKLVELETLGSQGSAQPKSLGQLVADSQEYKDAMEAGATNMRTTVEAAITSDSGSAGDLTDNERRPGIVAPPGQRLTIRDLLNWSPTIESGVEFVRETGFTNNADVVSENPAAGKPESDLTFEQDQAKVATIAHHIRASRQIMADARALQSHVDGRLRYGLKLKEEKQLLKGSGSNLNMHGIYPQASAYANPGVAVQNETMLDRLRLAMLQVTLAEYDADSIVLNPIDWTAIELTKTTDDQYLFATPRGLAAPGLWGRPVVATQSMDAGEFLTGSFSMGAQGYDREQVSVRIYEQDRDNAIKNMLTLLCEERLALAVERPESFVKGDFDGLTSS